jgi:glycosyltransferase involved in cell wall biosynthesis
LIQQGTAASNRALRTLYLEHGISAVREQAKDGAAWFSCLVRLVQAAIGIVVCSVEARQAVSCDLSPGLALFIEMVPALGDITWELQHADADEAAAVDGLHSWIESFYRSHPNATLDRSINQVSSLSDQLTDHDAESVAGSIFINRSFLQPRLLLDSGLLCHDTKGGIPRVGRNLVDHLTRSLRPGLRIELFRRDQAGLHTCSGAWKRLGVPEFDWTDVPIEPNHTDRVISLEFSLDAGTISALKQRNVRMYFVVYDILPSRHPDFFIEGSFRSFETWLESAVLHADGIICISQTVAHDLHEWLIERHIPRKTPLQIGWFHLGADLISDCQHLSPQEDQLVQRALSQPLAIIVGSLEYRSDRKGYGQALDAFQLLWARGYQGNLAIVGQHLSPSDELTERIANHPEFGRRLFWFESPTDPVLIKLYRSATVLLYPSHGEGFGLPLAEAAWNDLPIIARDLPVFREIAGPHIMYFDGFGGSDLAAAVERFWERRTLNGVPSSALMKPLSWAQSAEQFLSIILNENWHVSYGPTM